MNGPPPRGTRFVEEFSAGAPSRFNVGGCLFRGFPDGGILVDEVRAVGCGGHLHEEGCIEVSHGWSFPEAKEARTASQLKIALYLVS